MTQAGRCAGTLSKQDVTPAAPSALPYVNTLMNNLDTVGHNSYFKSSDQNMCPLDSCKLLQSDCMSERSASSKLNVNYDFAKSRISRK